MTDYLTGLALRNQRRGRGVRPRLPARFEPARGIGIFSVAGLPDKQKPAAVFLETTPRSEELPTEPIEREQPEILSPARRISRPAVRRRQGATITPSPATPWESTTQEKSTGSASRGEPAPEEPGSLVDSGRKALAPEKNAPAREWNIQPPSSPNKSPEQVAMPGEAQNRAPVRKLPEPGKGKRKKAAIPLAATEEAILPEPAYRRTYPGQVQGDRRETSPPENTPGVRAEHRMTGIPGPARTVMPEGIRRYSPEQETSGGKMPVQEPPVQVTIGRIEIRSVSEKDARAHRTVPPALDLSDYLRHPAKRGTQ
jgi:hypothetical protein